MKITLTGLNHNTAPVQTRERAALDRGEPRELYHQLFTAPELMEALFVSTCNRVEILTITPAGAGAGDLAARFLARTSGLDQAELAEHLYVLEEGQAVRHLFGVAAGLDSMVMGEPQILGQLKEAYRQGVASQATGVVLNKLLHKAFSVGKRVRTETGIGQQAVSVSFAAVQLARKIFGELAGRAVLLLGAGQMAELAARHLIAAGCGQLTVANRTLERAMRLAEAFNGQAASLEELPALLTKADIVICSTGAPTPLLTSALFRPLMPRRRHKPLFVVDIAVPRDAEAALNRLDNVFVYDIDDLKGIVENNRAQRQDEAAQARRIIEEEALKFTAWLKTLAVAPVIKQLTGKAERIREAELRRSLDHLDLTQAQEEAVRLMAAAITQKLLHDPIMFIKNAGHGRKKDEYLEITRKLFGLEGEGQG